MIKNCKINILYLILYFSILAFFTTFIFRISYNKIDEPMITIMTIIMAACLTYEIDKKIDWFPVIAIFGVLSGRTVGLPLADSILHNVHFIAEKIPYIAYSLSSFVHHFFFGIASLGLLKFIEISRDDNISNKIKIPLSILLIATALFCLNFMANKPLITFFNSNSIFPQTIFILGIVFVNVVFLFLHRNVNAPAVINGFLCSILVIIVSALTINISKLLNLTANIMFVISLFIIFGIIFNMLALKYSRILTAKLCPLFLKD